MKRLELCLKSLVKIHVGGDGKNVHSWRDQWINGNTIGDIALEVLALVPTRRRNNRRLEALMDNKWPSDVADS
jgi:hypothetical protein